MDIFLTNNLTNKKEQFIPKDKKNIGMYVCGPTVYDDPHIGNARPLVIFDILFRLLKSLIKHEVKIKRMTFICPWTFLKNNLIILNPRASYLFRLFASSFKI